MTSEGMGEMFEGDFADTRAEKLPLMPMGGQACAGTGLREWGPKMAQAEYFFFATRKKDLTSMFIAIT